MLSAIVPVNSIPSAAAKAICSRSERSVTERRSVPSTRIRPVPGSLWRRTIRPSSREHGSRRPPRPSGIRRESRTTSPPAAAGRHGRRCTTPSQRISRASARNRQRPGNLSHAGRTIQIGKNLRPRLRLPGESSGSHAASGGPARPSEPSVSASTPSPVGVGRGESPTTSSNKAAPIPNSHNSHGPQGHAGRQSVARCRAGSDRRPPQTTRHRWQPRSRLRRSWRCETHPARLAGARPTGPGHSAWRRPIGFAAAGTDARQTGPAGSSAATGKKSTYAASASSSTTAKLLRGTVVQQAANPSRTDQAIGQHPLLRLPAFAFEPVGHPQTPHLFVDGDLQLRDGIPGGQFPELESSSSNISDSAVARISSAASKAEQAVLVTIQPAPRSVRHPQPSGESPVVQSEFVRRAGLCTKSRIRPTSATRQNGQQADAKPTDRSTTAGLAYRRNGPLCETTAHRITTPSTSNGRV